MPYRVIPFASGEYYHLYNRGLEKQNLFAGNREYSRFIEAIFYYQIQSPKPKFSMRNGPKMSPVDESKKIMDILCYCLMPNHFHLLVKQIQEGGISEFMRKISESTTKYRNTKYNRQGPLFQGAFKAVHIETDEQLVHVSRYIHLNPLVALMVKDLQAYPWSSYSTFIGLDNQPVAKKEILGFFKSPKAYEKFVLDQADYGMKLELIKHTLIDIDE